MKRKTTLLLSFLTLSLTYVYTAYLLHNNTKIIIKKDMQMVSGILYSANIVLLDAEQKVEEKYANILYNAAISIVNNRRSEYIGNLDVAYYFKGKKTHILKGEKYLKGIERCIDTLTYMPMALECSDFYLYAYSKEDRIAVVGVLKKRVEDEKSELGLNRFFNELSHLGFFFYVALLDLNHVAYTTIDKRFFRPLKEDSTLLEAYIEGKEITRTVEILDKKVVEEVIPFSYGSFRGIMRIGVDGTEYFLMERRLLFEVGILYIVLFFALYFSYKFVERARMAEMGYKSVKEDMEKRIMEYEALGRVISEVSHAIKNPLNGISLIVQNLNMETKREEYDDILKMVKRIEENLNRFVLLVAKVRLSRECVSQRDIVKESIKLLGLKEGEDVRIEGDVTLKCDKSKILETYINIIKNAIEAKGGMVKVKIDKNSITFRNRGRIPEEALKRIFEPFFTTKKGGSGMGMYYVKKVIEAHGWNINVRNVDKEVEVKIEFDKDSRC